METQETNDPRAINKGVNLAKTAVEGTVDYITATTDRPQDYDRWWSSITRATKSWRERGGMEIEESRWKMYTGKSFGKNIFIGVSKNQGCIVKASGDWANELWPLIAPTARRVSRLDLAVTAKLTHRDLNVAKNHYSANEGSDKRVYSNIVNSLGGATTYVGSFSSDQSGRVYDKGAQQKKEPGLLWRYEVMIRNLKSLALARQLYTDWKASKPVPQEIAEYVYRWFKLRGCSPVWQMSNLVEALVEKELVIDTTTSRLKWLSTSVAPAIQKLNSQGLQGEVEEALGYRMIARIEGIEEMSAKAKRNERDDCAQETLPF